MMFKSGRFLVLVFLTMLSLSAQATSKYYYFFTEFHTYPSGAGKIYVTDNKSTDPSTITEWKESVEIQECKYTIGAWDYYIFGKPVGDYVMIGTSVGTRPDETSEWSPTFTEDGDVVIANQETPYRYTPSSSISDNDSIACVSKAPMFSTHCAFLVFTKVAAKVAEGYKNFGGVKCSKIVNDTGDKITIEAIPADERCHFTHWVRKSDGEQMDSNPMNVEVSKADEYYAYFDCDSATVIDQPDGGYVIWYSDNSGSITGPGKAESYSFAQDSLICTENNTWYVGKKVNTNNTLYTACPQILHVDGKIFVCDTPGLNSVYNLTNPLAQWSGESGLAAIDVNNELSYYFVDLEEKCFKLQNDVSEGIPAKTMYLYQSKSTFGDNIPEKIYWSLEDAVSATGINAVEIENAMKTGRIYNINGIQVKSLGRDGIYIIDGKKYMHKNK